MIHLLRPDLDHYEFLMMEKDEDTRSFEFDGRPLGPGWSGPPVHVHFEEKQKRHLPLGDTFGFVPGVPVFSKRATDALRPLIASHGEFHRLDCKEEDMYGFNVTTVVNGLDLKRSDFKTFSDSDRIMLVHKYVFIPSVVENLPIFKLIPSRRTPVFVNDSFVDLVKVHKLTGFLFTPPELGDLYWGPQKKSCEEKKYERAYKAKWAALERILGPMHPLFGCAIVGEAMAMHYFPNGVPGTGFATMELIEPDGSGPLPNRIGTYELVAFTRHPMPESLENSGDTPFNRIERRLCGVFTSLGSYSQEAVLNPGETCELPVPGELNRYLILDEYAPNGAQFKIGRQKHCLLLCLEVFKSEMEHARKHGADSVIQKLKQAGNYPYSDLDRNPVC